MCLRNFWRIVSIFYAVWKKTRKLMNTFQIVSDFIIEFDLLSCALILPKIYSQLRYYRKILEKSFDMHISHYMFRSTTGDGKWMSFQNILRFRVSFFLILSNLSTTLIIPHEKRTTTVRATGDVFTLVRSVGWRFM